MTRLRLFGGCADMVRRLIVSICIVMVVLTLLISLFALQAVLLRFSLFLTLLCGLVFVRLPSCCNVTSVCEIHTCLV
jgi:hypothetical protein